MAPSWLPKAIGSRPSENLLPEVQIEASGKPAISLPTEVVWPSGRGSLDTSARA